MGTLPTACAHDQKAGISNSRQQGRPARPTLRANSCARSLSCPRPHARSQKQASLPRQGHGAPLVPWHSCSCSATSGGGAAAADRPLPYKLPLAMPALRLPRPPAEGLAPGWLLKLLPPLPAAPATGAAQAQPLPGAVAAWRARTAAAASRACCRPSIMMHCEGAVADTGACLVHTFSCTGSCCLVCMAAGPLRSRPAPPRMLPTACSQPMAPTPPAPAPTNATAGRRCSRTAPRATCWRCASAAAPPASCWSAARRCGACWALVLLYAAALRAVPIQGLRMQCCSRQPCVSAGRALLLVMPC